MKMKIGVLLIFVLAAMLLASTLRISATTSAVEYNPWYDLDGDGKITIYDVVKVTGIYGSSGDPFAALAALEYDSGWIDITDKTGECFNITHNLNSTDIIVDITGKTTLDGGVHQRHLGLTGYTPGWSKTYGQTDIGGTLDCSMVQTSDGGYATAHTTPYPDNDFQLVKTDWTGNMMWNKTYGGPDSDRASSVVQIQGDAMFNPGGYAIAGCTDSYGSGSSDFWLVKTDFLGNMMWNKTYGGPDSDTASSVVESGGAFAIAGRTYSYGSGSSDFWLVHTDPFGNMMWNKTYGGVSGDGAHSMVQTVDGGYALAGETGSFGVGGDAWLVKTDSNGNMEWNKTYGGDDWDMAQSVVQTVDGGYAIAGMTWSFGASWFNFWLVKTDSAGDIEWSRTYGGYGWARSVVQTVDGGYAIAGWTGYYEPDLYLVKTDSYGNVQWNWRYGGAFNDYGQSVIQTSDGGYAIAGYTNSLDSGDYYLWLVKTGVESGLAWTDSTANNITLYRGTTDAYWNYVRIRIWKVKDNP